MSDMVERVSRALCMECCVDPDGTEGQLIEGAPIVPDKGEPNWRAFEPLAEVAIAAYEAAQWQPIETAPRDRYILLRLTDRPRWDGNMDVGKWFGDDEETARFWSTGGPNGGLELLDDYTHWRELPPDPPED